MPLLNEVIHQPVRLRIMAMLTALPPETQVVFSTLKGMLELTDGNLGAHLHKLEESGYVTITKTFVRNKPQTYVEVTKEGRQAFVEHTEALKEILDGNKHMGENGKVSSVKGHVG